MYGLVNKAIEELITTKFGAETWTKILERAQADKADFVSLDPYPDKITYDLVGAASEVLETPASDLLEAFGQFWIMYTAKEGYGDLLELAGSDLESFLENLDQLHARVALSFPELQPPSFEVEYEDDGSLKLHYHSDRPGLTPMLVGLLKGLGSRFSTDIEVKLAESSAAGADHDVFVIERVTTPV